MVSGSSQISYSGLTGVPSGIVSGSSQINITGTTGYSNITLQSVTDNGSSTDNPIVVESSNANKGVLGVEDLTISYYDNVGGQYHEQFIGGTNLDGLGYAGIKFGNGQVDGVFLEKYFPITEPIYGLRLMEQLLVIGKRQGSLSVVLLPQTN